MLASGLLGCGEQKIRQKNLERPSFGLVSLLDQICALQLDKGNLLYLMEAAVQPEPPQRSWAWSGLQWAAVPKC